MSGLLLFRNFEKRHNSTKRPDLSQGVSKNVNLKEDTSLRNPIFLLHDFDYTWNYCTFGYRYYYIDDVVFNSNNLYEIRCSIDVLATFKDSILATKANILYCSDSTKNIIDKRIPINSSMTVKESIAALNNLTITGYNNMGAVILGITGKGSFGTYLLSDSGRVSELLDGVDNWTSAYFTDTLTAIQQLVFGGSAGECLKGAIALPLALGSAHVGGGGAEQLYLGNYPCVDNNQNAITGIKITTPITTSVTSISIPWVYNDWRRNVPYSEVYLYLPFIGTLTLPASSLLNDNALTITYSINTTSGDVSVQYKGATSGRILGTASANIAMSTPFGSTGINPTKLASAVVAGVGTLIGGGVAIKAGKVAAGVLGIGGGLAAASATTIDALGGSGLGGGGLGGGATQGLDRVIHCWTISRELTDTQESFSETMGKPFFAKDNVGNHIGFVMTEGFTANMTGFADDKKEINSLMDAGVYIE